MACDNYFVSLAISLGSSLWKLSFHLEGLEFGTQMAFMAIFGKRLSAM